MTESKDWGFHIYNQLEASRNKPHADIILVTLKTGKMIIGKYSSAEFHPETGDGFIIINNITIPLSEIRSIQ